MITRLSAGITLFLILSLILYATQPQMVFDENGKPRSFGFHEEQSMFSLGVVIPIIAILSYFVATLIEVAIEIVNKSFAS
jgi:uncharacterized membrane protein